MRFYSQEINPAFASQSMLWLQRLYNLLAKQSVRAQCASTFASSLKIVIAKIPKPESPTHWALFLRLRWDVSMGINQPINQYLLAPCPVLSAEL